MNERVKFFLEKVGLFSLVLLLVGGLFYIDKIKTEEISVKEEGDNLFSLTGLDVVEDQQDLVSFVEKGTDESVICTIVQGGLQCIVDVRVFIPWRSS